MKIYLYDPDTGIYQGEDFADGTSFSEARGTFPGATAIVPPCYGPGVVPVFKEGSQRWEICSLLTLKLPSEKKHEPV